MTESVSQVYVLDDDVSVREAVGGLIRSAGLCVKTFASAQETLASLRKELPSCLVLDIQLPDINGLELQRELASKDIQMPIIFLTGHGDIPMSVRAIKAGALEFLTKPFDDEYLLEAIRQAIARPSKVGRSQGSIGADRCEDDSGTNLASRAMPDQAEIVFSPRPAGNGRPVGGSGEIVGQSVALRQIIKQVDMVAPTDVTVLILGETGTGKELIAQAVHNRSGRRDRPFIKVNCAAIPSGLLESELFGHEKGAFTGAIMRKPGRFELADKGTLFLDEVGDIPLELQAKLLRVLQEREFERLGSTRTQQVDVRVIAATHRDLKQMVEEGTFRSDLYYRLHVFPLMVPPLRDRREDIPFIVRHFVDKYSQRMHRHIETISPRTMTVLKDYAWPGNVRELQNFIERAVILSPGTSLRAPLDELTQVTVHSAESHLSTLEEMERQHVLRALKESNWVTGGPKGAAAKLGMKRTTLAYRIRKLGIPVRPQL